MLSLFLQGMSDRAKKEPYNGGSNTEYQRGWDLMTERLSPIETSIVLLAFQYQTAAKELMEKHGDGK